MNACISQNPISPVSATERFRSALRGLMHTEAGELSKGASMKICSVPNCTNQAKAREMCTSHYSRWRRFGDVLAQIPVSKKNPLRGCSVSGCSEPHSAKGLCAAHYQRFYIHGEERPEIAIGDRSGMHNANWKKGEVAFTDGRVLIYSPNHPHPNSGAYVFRYRLVVERHLGRYLSPDEIVHHKNNDPSDDRIENLEVMSQSEHARGHNQIRHAQRRANAL